MFDLLIVFTVGFLGSFHCLGMCGPIVLAYSLHINGPPKTQELVRWSLIKRGILHHLVFHAGRLLTYGFLGALAGGVVHLTDLGRFYFDLRSSVTLVGGILMVLAALVLLRIVPLPSTFTSPLQGPGSFLFRRLSILSQSNRLNRITSKAALGLAAGFLPCVLSWLMMIKAATTGNAIWGFLTMAVFGLGTVPALLLTGVFASLLSMRIRLMGERVAALSVCLMGLILIFRGVRAFA